MTYGELLKQYQAGTLEERARAELEREIEKQEAIGDFLFERSELPGFEDMGRVETPGEEDGGEEDRFTALVKKSIRRTLWHLGLAIGAVVLALTLFVVLALPSLVDHFYYDPTEILYRDEEGNGSPRVQTDIAIWTELFCPGERRAKAYVEPMGYGKYHLTFSRGLGGGDVDDYRPGAVSGVLERNEIHLYDAETMNLLTDSLSFVKPEHQEHSPEKARALSAAFIEGLSDTDWYRAEVSLAALTDYETLYRWCAERSLTGKSLWLQPYRELPEGVSDWVGLGFAPDGGPTLGFDEERYPELFPDYGWKFDGEEMEQHYLSLLRYTKDHPEFARAMGQGGEPFARALEGMMDYVEREGLQLYGFSFVGKKADILSLLEEPTISYLHVKPLR